jgi:pyroglutamyl-peptidase
MRAPSIVCGLAALAAAACADPGAELDPNAGLLRDFVDGKLDGAGHPLNARVTPGELLCPGAPATEDGVELVERCAGRVAGGEQRGELVVGLRVRVRANERAGDDTAVVVGIEVEGREVDRRELAVDHVRDPDGWTDVALRYDSSGEPVDAWIEPVAGTIVDVAYAELFPSRFRLVVGPGSGVLADADVIEVELPRGEAIDRLELDGSTESRERVDLVPHLAELLATGVATRIDTAHRSIIRAPVGALAASRRGVAQLHVRAAGSAARIELRRALAPCAYEGDPAGARVLVTGFQPFPADGWHDNVSERAVRAVRPEALRGAQVMRMILPVEYDRAAGIVTDLIARCAPDVVIGFGQGGGRLALEATAYNLKDTAEVPGGVPDNRGLIAAALPIDPAGPASRASTLPLAAIGAALSAIGEDPVPSDDPGRYICNNVFYAMTGAQGPARAGFVHLPYTASFDDATVARWGAAVETIITAAVPPAPGDGSD